MIGIGQIITSMLQKASVTGSRSTVLNPLSWMVALIITGLLTALSLSCPSWMLIVFIILLSIAFLAFMSSYLYFALKSPDSLRSERFTLSKMVLEKSIKGDNLTGLIDPILIAEERILPNIPNNPEEIVDES